MGVFIPVAVGILLFSTAIYLAQKRKGDLRKKISNNIEYSIGTVTKYVGGHRGVIVFNVKVTQGDPIINISFKVDTLQINTKSKGLLKSNMGGSVGKSYVVVYDATNPENCILLFDYPVNDSTDFARYMKEFKTNPPKLGK